MKYLLDVNALLAAIWATHANHSKVDAWVEGRRLVTCPLTELGFLRISTHPKALNSTMTSARELLNDFLERNSVEFQAADLRALQSKAANSNSNSVTDSYLAELAGSKGMKLATLDTGIVHPAVEVIRDGQ